MILRHGMMFRIWTDFNDNDHQPQVHTDVALLEQKQNSVWWSCMVVGGNHPDYKVGAYNVSVHSDDFKEGHLLETKRKDDH